LAKRRVFKGVAFAGDLDMAVADELDKIAKRDGTNFNAVMVNLARNHVSAHSKGNDVVPLTTFASKEGVVALPTIGEPLSKEERASYSDEALLLLIRHTTARLQEEMAECKKRGWNVDLTGPYPVVEPLPKWVKEKGSKLEDLKTPLAGGDPFGRHDDKEIPTED
jgi:hypothetical protein